jgi:hypothetical protein
MTVALVLASLLAACDLALTLARPFPEAPRDALVAIDAWSGVLAVAALLVGLARLFAHLGEDRLCARARGSLAILFLWAAFATATLLVRQLPASDLQWLSWPLSLVTAAVGLGLWIVLLWLVRDAQDALHL